jgi:hypothetical protein
MNPTLLNQEKRLLDVVTKCNAYMTHLEHEIKSSDPGFGTCPIALAPDTTVTNIGIGIPTPTSKITDTIVIGTGDTSQVQPVSNGIYIGDSPNLGGDSNIGIGRYALYKNIGSTNVAIGYAAMGGNGQQIVNTVAIGENSLYNGVAKNGISIGVQCSENSIQNDGAIAIGYKNSSKTVQGIADGKQQREGGIVIGDSAHLDGNQGTDAIAIGTSAFYEGTQSDGALSIGKGNFGFNGVQGLYSIALGDGILQHDGLQGQESIAIGSNVGINATQGTQSIIVGNQALNQGTQLNNSIAIGPNVLEYGGQQKSHSIVMGYGACSDTGNQAESCIALGHDAIKKAIQNARSIAIGTNTIFNGEQGSDSVSIGTNNFTNSKQNNSCIAIGTDIFNNQGGNQQQYSIAIGRKVCNSIQGQKQDSIVIGTLGGFIENGVNRDSILLGSETCDNLYEHGVCNINIGQRSGSSSDGTHVHANHTISIGTESGMDSNKDDGAISIGYGSGNKTYQKKGTIAVGKGSSQGVINNTQNIGAIAIGENAGCGYQMRSAIAIGRNAGQGSVQGRSAIAIGENAISGGQQGDYSIAIGKNAGCNGQKEYSIVISASGTDLPTPRDEFIQEGGLYISPIRHDENKPQIRTHHHIFYNPLTGEVTSKPLNEFDTISGFYKEGLVINNHIVGEFDVYGTLDTTSPDGQGVIVADTMVLQNLQGDSAGNELYYNTVTGEIVMVVED